MPFENTHLFLADKVRKKLQDEGLSIVLKEHLAYYYLGSIFPDILFYSKEKDVSRVAFRLHGDDGEPTNRFALDMLDRIRGKDKLHDFAFTAGFLTHCAADITFHPIVFYVSGYKPEASKKDAQKCSYLHWKFETLIDSRLNDRFRVEDCVQEHLVGDLVVSEILGVDAGTIVKNLKKQRGYFSKIRSRFFYHVFRALSALGLVSPEAVAGCYESLKIKDITLPERILYRDVFSGEKRETSLDALVERSVDLGERLVIAAYAYFTGDITREACQQVIAGEDLHTGRVGKTLKDVRHSAVISR